MGHVCAIVDRVLLGNTLKGVAETTILTKGKKVMSLMGIVVLARLAACNVRPSAQNEIEVGTHFQGDEPIPPIT